MRVFITGGTGFIGHYVSRRLLESGHKLSILTRHPQKIPSFSKNPDIMIIPGSIYDAGAITKGLEGCDACIHIALGWGETPLSMLENDTRATILILQAAANAGCKKFIYTSSTAAMGKFRPTMNENTASLPIDLYGATKAAGEAYVLGYTASKMARNIIRPGYTFGNPACADGISQPDKRFANMAETIATDKDIYLIKNDGTQFIHAADQALLFEKVLDSNFNEQIFLGLGNTWISWKEIAHKMMEIYTQITGKRSKTQILEKDLGWSDEPMMFSVEKIAATFGLSFDGRQSIEDHLRWQLTTTLKHLC